MNKKRLLMVSGLASVFLATASAWAVVTHNEQVRITTGGDAGLGNNTGFLVVGANASTQVAIDNNEILARNNGSTATLSLQNSGGLTSVGGSVDIDGDLFVLGDMGDMDVNGYVAAVDDIIASSDIHLTGSLFWSPPADGATSTICHSFVTGRLGQCNSSMRFKTDIAVLANGLRTVMEMKPVTFSWKMGGRHDLGFIAEDAVAVVPELVEYDDKGTVTGFNYRHYTAVLTRAIQEQQNTIQDQRVELTTTQQAIALRDKEIGKLQTEVAELQQLRDEVKALTKAVARLSAQ